MTYTILSSARKNGAQLMVANCPLCQFNLDKQQVEMGRRRAGYEPIPVFYFAQLLGVALGLETDDFGWEKHYIDPQPVLEAFA
jgi:heterodisulfide reductase subunit B